MALKKTNFVNNHIFFQLKIVLFLLLLFWQQLKSALCVIYWTQH